MRLIPQTSPQLEGDRDKCGMWPGRGFSRSTTVVVQGISMTQTGTEDRRQVLVSLRKRLRVPQALVEKRTGLDHSRYSRWECGYTELTESELRKVEQCLTHHLESWRAALAEMDVASA
jgi:hypothetical protein